MGTSCGAFERKYVSKLMREGSLFHFQVRCSCFENNTKGFRSRSTKYITNHNITNIFAGEDSSFSFSSVKGTVGGNKTRAEDSPAAATPTAADPKPNWELFCFGGFFLFASSFCFINNKRASIFFFFEAVQKNGPLLIKLSQDGLNRAKRSKKYHNDIRAFTLVWKISKFLKSDHRNMRNSFLKPPQLGFIWESKAAADCLHQDNIIFQPFDLKTLTLGWGATPQSNVKVFKSKG